MHNPATPDRAAARVGGGGTPAGTSDRSQRRRWQTLAAASACVALATTSMMAALAAEPAAAASSVQTPLWRPLKNMTATAFRKNSTAPVKPPSFLAAAPLNFPRVEHPLKAAKLSIQRAKSLFSKNARSARLAGNSTTALGSNNLTNINDLLYTTTVFFGDGQQLVIDLDTGSSDVWARGPNCVSEDLSCGPGSGNVVNTTDPTIFPTGETFDDSYGSGEAAGDVYRGPVTLAGLTANISFGVTTQEIGFGNLGDGDGLFGLAFDSLNAINGGNWIDKLHLEPSQNQFAFYLSRRDDGDLGEVAVGGYNPARFTGDITWVPLFEELWWEFDFTGNYLANGQNGPLTSTAIADTGTSLIILDTATADSINSAIGAVFDPNEGVYTVPCDQIGKTAPIFLNFGGKSFELPSSRYLLKFDDTLCFSGFVGGAGNGVPNILGDVFLQVYYSIYDKDQKRVGFAQAVHPSGFGESGPSLPPGPPTNVTGSLFTKDLFSYHGGPVIGSVEVKPLFYGNVSFGSELTQFYKDFVQSPFLVDVLSEYSTNSTKIGKGSVSAIYQETDVSSLPSGSSLTDVAIYVRGLVAAGKLVPNPNLYVPVHFAPGISITDEVGFDICQFSCSLHLAVKTDDISSEPFLYVGIIPDTTPDCACGIGTDLTTNLDLTIYSSWGVLALTIPDPLPGEGWYNDEEGEIAGPCLFDVGRWNGYPTFAVFSNKHKLCIDQIDPAKFAFNYPYGHDEVAIVHTSTLAFPNVNLQLFDLYFNVILVTRAKRNVADVRVEFTRTDFNHSNEVSATFVKTFNDGEFGYYTMTWRYGYLGLDDAPETILRAYAIEKSGTRKADPNNDYWLQAHATQTNPLLLLTQGAYLDTLNQIHTTGMVRNLGFSQRYDFNKGTVKLNYTTSNWAKSKRVDLQLNYSNKTWTYDIILGKLDGPLMDSFASQIEYYASNGRTYTLPGVSGSLKPTVSFDGDDNELADGLPLDGHYLILQQFNTILPLSFAFPSVSIDGVQQASDLFIAIDSKDYAPGRNHTISITQVISNGGQITLNTNFTVSHDISGGDIRSLDSGGLGNKNSISLLGTKLAVAYDSAVAVYDYNGGSDIKATLPNPAGFSGQWVAVRADSVGQRFFALDSNFNIYRWNASLALDAGFVGYGSGSSDFAVLGNTTWFLNGNAVIVVYANGTVIDALTLPGAPEFITYDPADPTKIYILAQPTDAADLAENGQLIPTTVYTYDIPSARLTSQALDFPVSKQVRGFATLGADRFVVAVYNAFFVYNRKDTSKYAARWVDVYKGFASVVSAPAPAKGFSALGVSFNAVVDFAL
ncbi:hypothetical protein DFJ73DRAFT_905679 [Zopfochytrium polystomum]|nr:hypothetical protein DFJ73DRAFT_905679 [Zopfochytrium polystomum]